MPSRPRLRTRLCDLCEEPFTFPATSSNLRFCSDPCRRENRNRRERQRTRDLYGRSRTDKVGMDCLLCGRPLSAHQLSEQWCRLRDA